MARLVRNINTRPPKPRTAIRLPLAVLREVDATYAGLPRVACQGKCQECCCPVGNLMNEFERDRIIARTGKTPNGFDVRRVEGSANVIDMDNLKNQRCNLLNADGTCSVYDIRPMVCRLYGSVPGMSCPHDCHCDTPLTDDEGAAIIATLNSFCHRNYL